MGEREIFEQINDVLRENGYNTRINGLMDLTHKKGIRTVWCMTKSGNCMLNL